MGLFSGLKLFKKDELSTPPPIEQPSEPIPSVQGATQPPLAQSSAQYFAQQSLSALFDNAPTQLPDGESADNYIKIVYDYQTEHTDLALLDESTLSAKNSSLFFLPNAVVPKSIRGSTNRTLFINKRTMTQYNIDQDMLLKQLEDKQHLENPVQNGKYGQGWIITPGAQGVCAKDACVVLRIYPNPEEKNDNLDKKNIDQYLLLARGFEKISDMQSANKINGLLQKYKSETDVNAKSAILKTLLKEKYDKIKLFEAIKSKIFEPAKSIETQITELSNKRDAEISDLNKKYSAHYSASKPLLAPETLKSLSSEIIQRYDTQIIRLVEQRSQIESQTDKEIELFAGLKNTVKSASSKKQFAPKQEKSKLKKTVSKKSKK